MDKLIQHWIRFTSFYRNVTVSGDIDGRQIIAGSAIVNGVDILNLRNGIPDSSKTFNIGWGVTVSLERYGKWVYCSGPVSSAKFDANYGAYSFNANSEKIPVGFVPNKNLIFELFHHVSQANMGLIVKRFMTSGNIETFFITGVNNSSTYLVHVPTFWYQTDDIIPS